MYFLFKKDPWGNNIPVYAAQTDAATTNFGRNSREKLYTLWVPGNTRTLFGL